MSHRNFVNLLSLDECQIIISKYCEESNYGTELKVHSYEIVPATEAKGFLGEYFHLFIKSYPTNEHDLELSVINESDAILLKFFIKNLPPVDEQHEKVTIFRKESSLYAPTPWCPKVYLCYRNLLVLEDLDSLGYCSLASRESLTETEMLPILKGLAAMHASSILYELDTQDNIESSYYESLKEITVHPDIPWFTTGLKAILEVAKYHSKYQSEVSQKFIADELPLHLRGIYFMVNASPKYRNVLCHRDTWGGNIFLDPMDTDKSAMFVDFQTCRYSPAAIDVIFTLFMNLTKDERLSKQSEYLKYYYEQLSKHMEEKDQVIFTETEFMESIEEFQLFGLVYRALAASILKVPKEMVDDYYKNEERSVKLLEYMQESEEFRLLMEECIEDIIEAVVDLSIKSDIY
ncbi:hypothetical protein DOY81_004221 [Sarcophaga bullata]|nr:hypothetical protein DOY81_004221 [Sarcophaga bullata]